eukprot:CAMPEP_0181289588 /NCGR_PEP_ID=MMETSP1101-20121128/959_1 /TAXON_ID=46948 /ORGANISM="Rhodomonas abbreviata, Strain Caron Lab Isolate" /LENGTH=490 /DNA_ID=CAMNT_0023393813 /DNA_START=181 /DNA_END=1650 /DNA_ORIENTATION=+
MSDSDSDNQDPMKIEIKRVVHDSESDESGSSPPPQRPCRAERGRKNASNQAKADQEACIKQLKEIGKKKRKEQKQEEEEVADVLSEEDREKLAQARQHRDQQNILEDDGFAEDGEVFMLWVPPFSALNLASFGFRSRNGSVQDWLIAHSRDKHVELDQQRLQLLVTLSVFHESYEVNDLAANYLETILRASADDAPVVASSVQWSARVSGGIETRKELQELESVVLNALCDLGMPVGHLDSVLRQRMRHRKPLVPYQAGARLQVKEGDVAQDATLKEPVRKRRRSDNADEMASGVEGALYEVELQGGKVLQVEIPSEAVARASDDYASDSEDECGMLPNLLAVISIFFKSATIVCPDHAASWLLLLARIRVGASDDDDPPPSFVRTTTPSAVTTCIDVLLDAIAEEVWDAPPLQARLSSLLCSRELTRVEPARLLLFLSAFPPTARAESLRREMGVLMLRRWLAELTSSSSLPSGGGATHHTRAEREQAG